MSIQHIPVMQWYSSNLPEFKRGVQYFERKHGVPPKVVFINHKHKPSDEENGWDIPEGLEIIEQPMPLNHYVLCVNAADFRVTERKINAPMSSV